MPVQSDVMWIIHSDLWLYKKKLLATKELPQHNK